MIGTQVSHYRILERLGGGGMGEVFKAEDLRLGRPVALKFLPPELGRDPVGKERFLKEARAASALDHPHICTVHDVDEAEDGRLFLAMAFYDGETLKKRLAAGPLPIVDALGIAEQVAEGLVEAHGEGITHRDIKPANLMLTRDGTVKIVDFGLAKLAGDPGLTKTGMSVGTPAYMSPEQARGEAVDHRTDLWSLGVVLYEMLAGRRPFEGSSEREILHGILYEEPPSLGTLRAGIPPAVEKLAEDLLARDPSRRLATAREALERFRSARKEAVELTDAPTLTRPGLREPERPPNRIIGARRAVLGGALAVAVILAVLGVVLWVDRVGKESELPVLAQGEAAPSPLSERKMVVVLPLENLGPPEHEYFAAGITEELTSRLATVGGLGVISRNTAVHYPAAGKTMQEIGEDLGVGYVLEGTVRWAPAEDGPGRVRITPQLIRTADDTHLWADAYEATLDDVFRVQSEIAERVVDELEVTLLASERETIEKRPTESTEAYNAYLRGLYHRGHNPGLEEHAWAAVEALQEAVRLDPGFVLAWAELAKAHGVLFAFRYDRNEERAEASRRAAERALELDPDSPHAHLALGSYHYQVERDYERALEEYEIAREGLPSSGEVRALMAYALRRQGRWEESVAMLREATALDPRNWEYSGQLANALVTMRRYQEALEVGRRKVAMNPGSSALAEYWRFLNVEKSREMWHKVTDSDTDPLHRASFLSELDYLEGRYEDALERLTAYEGDELHLRGNFHAPKELRIGAVLTAMGNEDGARRAYELARRILEARVETRPNDPRPHSALGLAYSGLGRAEEAIPHGRRAIELTPVSKDALEGQIYLHNLSRIYARLGEVEAALDILEELFSIPAELSIHLLELDPVFAPLRDHPRYRALVERYRTDQPVDP